jgi:hypothetical protein
MAIIQKVITAILRQTTALLAANAPANSCYQLPAPIGQVPAMTCSVTARQSVAAGQAGGK